MQPIFLGVPHAGSLTQQLSPLLAAHVRPHSVLPTGNWDGIDSAARLQGVRFRPIKLEHLTERPRTYPASAPLPSLHRDDSGNCMQRTPIQRGGASGVHDAVPFYATVCTACTNLQGGRDSVGVSQQDEENWCLPPKAGARESVLATPGALQSMFCFGGAATVQHSSKGAPRCDRQQTCSVSPRSALHRRLGLDSDDCAGRKHPWRSVLMAYSV
jgi:hypothetical protein